MTGKETAEEPLDHQQLFSVMRSLKGGSTLYSGKVLGNFLSYKLQFFQKFGENGFSSAAAVCKGVLIPYLL